MYVQNDHVYAINHLPRSRRRCDDGNENGHTTTQRPFTNASAELAQREKKGWTGIARIDLSRSQHNGALCAALRRWVAVMSGSCVVCGVCVGLVFSACVQCACSRVCVSGERIAFNALLFLC